MSASGTLAPSASDMKTTTPFGHIFLKREIRSRLITGGVMELVKKTPHVPISISKRARKGVGTDYDLETAFSKGGFVFNQTMAVRI
jgi:hypothetical protein